MIRGTSLWALCCSQPAGSETSDRLLLCSSWRLSRMMLTSAVSTATLAALVALAVMAACPGAGMALMAENRQANATGALLDLGSLAGAPRECRRAACTTGCHDTHIPSGVRLDPCNEGVNSTVSCDTCVGSSNCVWCPDSVPHCRTVRSFPHRFVPVTSC